MQVLWERTWAASEEMAHDTRQRPGKENSALSLRQMWQIDENCKSGAISVLSWVDILLSRSWQ